ncbi:2710_t:CDS:2, partial [Funneliformis caledonium]
LFSTNLVEAAGIGSNCSKDYQCDSQICRSHMISGRNQCHSSDDRPVGSVCLVNQACDSLYCHQAHKSPSNKICGH